MRILKQIFLILIIQQIAFGQQKGSEDAISQEIIKIEKSIEELKNKILETKSQLLILTEMFEKGTLTGTKISVTLNNSLSEKLNLKNVKIFVNGFQVYSSAGPPQGKKVVAYDESVSPGNFKIEVVAEFTGTGGIFKKEKQFEFSKDTVVEVEKGQTTDVLVNFEVKGDSPEISFLPTKKKTLPGVMK